mgnify:CR=1 FL=1
MGLTPVKTPWLLKKLFPNYVWNMPATEKIIYLTFDDGPTPKITNWTLNVLKQYKAKATFFCIGNNVEKHPEIFHDILKDGHAIGNHTKNHIKGWKTKTKDYIKNIDLCENVLKAQIQKSLIDNQKSLIVNLFRPPYGQIKPKQGKKLIDLGYKIIMWDVLSFDWENHVSEKKCLNNIINNTSEGSIIVFHDSVKASKNMQYALPKMLAYFSERGYNFKAL